MAASEDALDEAVDTLQTRFDARLDGMDRDGTAFGRVTRERVDSLVSDMHGLRQLLVAVSVGVFLQLFAFVMGILLFLLNHARF